MYISPYLILLHLATFALSHPVPISCSRPLVDHLPTSHRRPLLSSSRRPGVLPRAGPPSPVHHLDQLVSIQNQKRRSRHDDYGKENVDDSIKPNRPYTSPQPSTSSKSTPVTPSSPSVKNSDIHSTKQTINVAPSSNAFNQLLSPVTNSFRSTKQSGDDENPEDEGNQGEHDGGSEETGEKGKGSKYNDEGSDGEGFDNGSGDDLTTTSRRHSSTTTSTAKHHIASSSHKLAPTEHTSSHVTNNDTPRPTSASVSPASSDDGNPNTGSSLTSTSTSSGIPARAPTASPPAPTSQTDCQILSNFFRSVSGPTWKNQMGWQNFTAEDSCCDAYGVSCNSIRRVSAIDLEGNGLRGPFDDEILGLSYLLRLNLSSNALTGPLPDEFITVPYLASLYVANNLLTGPLPPSLLTSTTLSSIHLSNNSFTGSISFPSASNLSSLYADRNQFAGNLDFTGNGGMQKIVLDYNKFDGVLPDLEPLTNLQLFTVSRNGFSGEVQGLGNLTMLTKLDVSQNALTGPSPDPVGLTHLTDFLTSGNSFTGAFPISTAPASLTNCKVDPLVASSCPSTAVLSSPTSLASVCKVVCRGGGKPRGAAQAEVATTNPIGNGKTVQDSNAVMTGTGGRKKRSWASLMIAVGVMVLVGF